MKLQKRLNKKIKDKIYLKWYVDIPFKLIQEIGWQKGTNLKAIIKDGKLIISVNDIAEKD